MSKVPIDQIALPGTKAFIKPNLTDKEKDKRLKNLHKKKVVTLENSTVRISHNNM